MKGTSETTFELNLSLTRAMLVTIIYRMNGSDYQAAESAFSDVALGTWYFDEVAWAAENLIATGYGHGLFGPNDPVTREQLAAIMYRCAVSREYSDAEDADLSSFADSSQIHEWAEESMEWAVATGMLSGKGNGILDPLGKATRAEVAAIMERFNEKFVNSGSGDDHGSDVNEDPDDDNTATETESDPADYIKENARMIIDNPTNTGTAAASNDEFFLHGRRERYE